MLQPAETSNVTPIPQPENIAQYSAKDSGSESEQEIWSFDRAINEVFRLLPQGLCPRPTEEHTSAKPLSGIEHLMGVACVSIISATSFSWWRIPPIFSKID